MVIEKLLAAMDDPRQPVLAIYQGPVAPVIVTVVVVDPERVFAGERKTVGVRQNLIQRHNSSWCTSVDHGSLAGEAGERDQVDVVKMLAWRT